MRILALVTDAFGGYGGIAQYNRDLLTALNQSARVEDIVVIPRMAQPDIGPLPAKVRQLLPQSSRAAFIAASLYEAGMSGPFDLVFNGHLYQAPLAELIGRLWKVPVWLQTHGIEAWECPGPIVRASAEHATLITAVSRYTKQRLTSWANVEPERVKVLPNTFRLMFSPGPPDDDILRANDLKGRKIILTVSRLAKADHYKGHERIIEAMPQVLSTHPDALYVVVGEGDARTALEQLVARVGLAQHVRFLGRMSDAEVLKLYRSAHVFAMPSTKEGFGIVFVEAAVTGLHVIAGNRDGSKDALADGVIGRLIDPENVGEIVRSLDDSLTAARKSDLVEVQRFASANFVRHVDRIIGTLMSC